MGQENKLTHNEEWEFYMCNVDNMIGSFRLDLGLREIAPFAEKPNLVWVGVAMQNAREDGLSSNAENHILYAIEDKLEENFKKQNAILAGCLTSNFERIFYYYVADSSNYYEKSVLPAFAHFPNYEFFHGTKEDKDWTHYFDFLYPSPCDYQKIMSRRVIMNLEKQGDNLTRERMVDHWIYFKNGQNMNQYVLEISKENFQVLSQKFNEEYKEYVLNVGRMDKVDFSSVNDYVLYLWELAGEYNGHYDGWGCTVEKD